MQKEQKLVFQSLCEEDLNAVIAKFLFPWTTLEATQEKWMRYHDEHQADIRTVCIVKIENEIIGYGSVLYATEYPDFKNSGIPEINDVWISEEHRRNGFGELLIQYLETIAKKEHHKQIGLGVGLYKDYGAAQKLYVRMGYVPDGNGVTYNYQPVVPGESYPVDDELIIWLRKDLS